MGLHSECVAAYTSSHCRALRYARHLLVLRMRPPCNTRSPGAIHETTLLSAALRASSKHEAPRPVNRMNASRHTFNPRNLNCMRQRPSCELDALWANKLARKSVRRCCLRDAHGSDNHRTLQLYTIFAVNAAMPTHPRFPGACAWLCRSHVDRSSIAANVGTLSSPEQIFNVCDAAARRCHRGTSPSRSFANFWY